MVHVRYTGIGDEFEEFEHTGDDCPVCLELQAECDKVLKPFREAGFQSYLKLEDIYK